MIGGGGGGAGGSRNVAGADECDKWIETQSQLNRDSIENLRLY